MVKKHLRCPPVLTDCSHRPGLALCGPDGKDSFHQPGHSDGALKAPKPSQPVLAGASSVTDGLSMPEACLYGIAGEQAKLLQAPMGWAYPTILTLYAGMGVSAAFSGSEPLPPRLFTALLGDKGDGKSRTITRARTLIGNDSAYLTVANLNSDRARQAVSRGRRRSRFPCAVVGGRSG